MPQFPAHFHFTDRDAEIIQYVYELRLATLDHLVALTNRSYKTLERRVPKLRAEKYLQRLRPRPHKGLYVIGREAVPLLIREGYAPDDIAEKRRRETEWKDLTIPHALLLASIHTKLLLLSRGSPITLTAWHHDGPDLWDNVQTPQDGKLPVRPDAHFILRHAKLPADKNNKLHFFLEADVGTMSHGKIESKINAYIAYHEQQKHVTRFGINYFQVAIISATSARADNLREQFHASLSAAQRRAYHFIALQDLTFTALLGGLERQAA